MENVSTKSPVALSPAERQPDAYSHHKRVGERKMREGKRKTENRERKREEGGGEGGKLRENFFFFC